MGIHFACHHCNFALHVKDFQAGKRGRCPQCQGAFRIPIKDASYSSAVDDPSYEPAGSSAQERARRTTLDAINKLGQEAEGDESGGIALATNADAIELAPTIQTTKDVSDPKNRTDKPEKTEAPKPAPKAPVEASATIKASDTVSVKNKAAATKKKSKSAPPAVPATMPSVLSDVPDARWYVRPPSGGQYGPAPGNLLMQWIAERRVTADSLLWRDGLAQWQLANELLPDSFPEEDFSTPPENAPVDGVLTNAPTEGMSGQLHRKRSKKRRQQMYVVFMLGMISLVLLGILIFVLIYQVATSGE